MEHRDYTEVHAGTEVTRTLLDRLGCPDDFLKIIHIAGTNGKGSTAEYFTQILIAAGKKTGTFTSPAIYDFYDQFRIDGKPLEGAVAERYFERAQAVSYGLNPTDFELQTAGIICAFKEEGCEYAVIECGMGGLNDATNAIHKKELAVITSISLEHTEYLGRTVEEICAQKAGIITNNCPAVICDYQPTEAARNYFKNLGGYFANRITYVGGNGFWYCDREYELSANGRLQAYNAATAIEGAKILGLPEEAIYAGIRKAKPKGRVEEFTLNGRRYILDGAHNPASFAPLAEILKRAEHPVTIIFGCLKDKDIEGNLAALKGLAEGIVAVQCESVRKMPLDKIVENCRKYFKEVGTAESVTDALDKAYTKTVAVCGSFTLLKEAKLWIERGQ